MPALSVAVAPVFGRGHPLPVNLVTILLAAVMVAFVVGLFVIAHDLATGFRRHAAPERDVRRDRVRHHNPATVRDAEEAA